MAHQPWQQRTQLLLQEEALALLTVSHVLIVGVGGVGAYAAEMLCRAGVGELTIIDADVVSVSNINRQLVALHSTIDQPKVAVLAARLYDINPLLLLHTQQLYLDVEAVEQLLKKNRYSYIVDAIDTVAPKVALIATALRGKQKIISSMGAGARMDITQIKYADISETYHCGLAKAVRTGLKKEGIKKGLPVVFSTEQSDKRALILTEGERNKKSTVGTISYLPATFGCYLAAYVIRKLTKK